MKRRRFYLLTYPRSASNLLVRILALDKQPNVTSGDLGGYFFISSYLLMKHLKLRGKHIEEWTQDQRTQMMQSYQDSFNKLEEHVESGEAEDKIVFVKEHGEFMVEPTAQTRFLFGQNSVEELPWTVQIPSTYGPETTHSSFNETVLPDEFLRTWLPTFLVRHPALVFPSHYRTIIQNENVEAAEAGEAQKALVMTLHWSRSLYDWYTQHLCKTDTKPNGDVTWPLVVDADDIMTKPEVMIRLCEILGMDPTKLQFTWKPASDVELAQLPSIRKIMLSTLLASAGVIREKSSIDLDIDVEAEKWRSEFGQREGEKMEKWVRAAMPDYEFMKARRLRPRAA
ncbi:hypothetical protein LTR66_009082 [Elasticomyces elasticus]|nr:hypothetical protein LTR66_009082 [Elasticomyces elasticus]